MTKLSTGMQRVILGKYFSVQYIVSYRDIHAYIYYKYSDTLNTFNMLCPLNKAKVTRTHSMARHRKSPRSRRNLMVIDPLTPS